MRRLLPRRRIFRVAIYFCCLILVLIAADMIWTQIRRQIHPGFDTTRIVSPTLPDGSVDYVLAHDDRYGQGVTSHNNAAVLLLEALGRAPLPPNQPTDGITDRLGMPHLPEKGDYFIKYRDYCGDHPAQPDDNPIDSLMQNEELHWPVKIGPVSVQWTSANEKPLALIVEASKRTRFFIPWYGGNRQILLMVLLPHLSSQRDMAKALLTRAMLRLEAGDVAAFQENVLAVHRLARLAQQGGGTLVEQLVAWGMDNWASRVDRLAASSGKLSADQLRAFADQLDKLGDMPSYLQSIDTGERFMALDMMQAVAHGSPQQRSDVADILRLGWNGNRHEELTELTLRFWPIPCEDAMRELNRFYDGMIVAGQQPSYAQRIAALNLWERDIIKIKQRNLLSLLISPDLAVVVMMPSLTKLETQLVKVRMQRRLTLITLALAAYKADHRTYPANLGQLSCDCTDLFVDRPVIYLPNSKGYLLYSVGPNMTDDGGKQDDIAVNVP